LRITKQRITDQRFLFLGGGSAGTGIAELICQAMALEGMDIKEARRTQLTTGLAQPARPIYNRPARRTINFGAGAG